MLSPLRMCRLTVLCMPSRRHYSFLPALPMCTTWKTQSSAHLLLLQPELHLCPDCALSPGSPSLTARKRCSVTNCSSVTDWRTAFVALISTQASRSTVDSSLLMGLDLLCEGRRAFVNCTRDVLLKDYITLLPSSHTIVEVLETVPVDESVLKACQRLKEAGYLIALDDFVAHDPRERLTDLADIIKVDIRRTTPPERVAIVKRYGPWRHRMLAEKVETREEFTVARDLGFLYFEGFFFRRPEVMTTHEIPANRINYLRMLEAVAQPELDLREIEKIIKVEASLCYRLLRYLNSALFAFSSEIHSVRHALSMMGEREFAAGYAWSLPWRRPSKNPANWCSPPWYVRAFASCLAPGSHTATQIYFLWACSRSWMSFSKSP